MLPIVQSDSANNCITGTQPSNTHATTAPSATVAASHDTANVSIYHLNSTARTVAQRVDFLSRIFGNPADSYLHTAAVAGHLKSIPNITAENIKEFAPNNIESAKGLTLSRRNTNKNGTPYYNINS